MEGPQPKNAGLPALVRVGGASFIPSLLREFDLDADAIARRAKLEPKVLDNADHLITYASLGHLLDICVRETNCKHFGLLLGERSGGAYLGILHSIARNSPNVGAALRTVIRYFHHHDQAALAQLVVADESVSLEYVIPSRSVGRDIIGDGAMAIAYCLMKELVSPAWAPIKVRLPRQRPADIRPYTTFFGPTVEFGAGASALVFSPHWLDEPIPPASMALRTLIEQHLEKTDRERSTKLSDHLRRVIVAGIGFSEPSLEMAAAALAISGRTLNRRLRQENMTFRCVVDEVRLALATELLETTETSVADIANQLRYSETSVFIRAFRRWTGHSPGAWRLRYRTGDSEIPLPG